MNNDKFKKKMVKIASNVISEHFEQFPDSLKIPKVVDFKEELRMIGYCAAIFGKVHTLLISPFEKQSLPEMELHSLLTAGEWDNEDLENINEFFADYYTTTHSVELEEKVNDGDTEVEVAAMEARNAVRFKSRAEALEKVELFHQMMLDDQ